MKRGRILYRVINNKNRKAFLQQGGIVPSGMNPAFMPYIPAKAMVVEPIKANELPSPPSIQKPSFDIKIEKGTPLAKSYIHQMATNEANEIAKTYAGLQEGKIDVSEGQKIMQARVSQLQDVLRRYNTSTIAQEQEMYAELRKGGYDGALAIDPWSPLGSVSGTISVLGNSFNGATDLEKAFVNFHTKEGVTNLSRGIVYNKPTKNYSDLYNSFFSGKGFFGGARASAGLTDPSSPLDGVLLYGTFSQRTHSKSNLKNIKYGLEAAKNVAADGDVMSFVYREGNLLANKFYESRGYGSSVDALAEGEVVFGALEYSAISSQRAELVSKMESASDSEREQIKKELKKLEEREKEVKENAARVNMKAKEVSNVLSEELGIDLSQYDKYVKAALVAGYDIYNDKKEIDPKKRDEFLNMVYAFAVYDEAERAQFSGKSPLDRAGLYYNLANESDPERYAAMLRTELAKKLGVKEEYLKQAASHLSDINKTMVISFGLDNRDNFDLRLSKVKEMQDATAYKSLSLRNASSGGGSDKKREEEMRDILFKFLNNPEAIVEESGEVGLSIDRNFSFETKIGDDGKATDDPTASKQVAVYEYTMNVNTDIPPPKMIQGSSTTYQNPDLYFTNPKATTPPQLMLKTQADGKVKYIPVFLLNDLPLPEGSTVPSGAFVSHQVYVKEGDKDYRKAAAYQGVPITVNGISVKDEGKTVEITIGGNKYVGSVPSLGKYREFLRTHSSSSVFSLGFGTPSVDGEAVVYVYNPAFKKQFSTNENAPQARLGTVSVREDGGIISTNQDDEYVKSLIDSIFD